MNYKLNVPILILLLAQFSAMGQSKIKNEKIIERIISKTAVHHNTESTIDIIYNTEKRETDIIFDDEYFNELKEEINEYTYNKLYSIIYKAISDKYSEKELKALEIKMAEGLDDEESSSFQAYYLNEFRLVFRDWFDSVLIIGNNKSYNKLTNDFAIVDTTNFRRFKQGKFQYFLPDNSIVTVKREGDLQTETSNGEDVVMIMDWKDDFKYDLITKSCSREEMFDYYKNQKMRGEIKYADEKFAIMFLWENDVMIAKAKYSIVE